MSEMADRAFRPTSMPQLSMGCGVFLQSDINSARAGRRKKFLRAVRDSSAECVDLCGRAEQLLGWKKYILQGGTHKNLAVVKNAGGFHLKKVPDADVVVHPFSGEAGAIGAALVASDLVDAGGTDKFRGFDAIERLTYKTSATSVEHGCSWCPVTCQRSFIDVELEGGKGREWSKVPPGSKEGWERVIVSNSCPKGLVEDLNEMKVIKIGMEKTKNAFPNVADLVL